MSQFTLDYAKPKSALPTKGTWARIVVGTVVGTAMAGWLWHGMCDGGQAENTGGPGLSSVPSTLEVMREQIERFKDEHEGHPPVENRLELMTMKTHSTDTSLVTPGGTLGPYVCTLPVNPKNGRRFVGTAPGEGVAWVYRVKGDECEFYATDETGMKLLPY